ncbi:MAG: EVE domain-containing protein [Thermomicrobiales bacterium]
MPRYWIGVASAEHVRRGVSGGFAQLNHGKAAPLRRMAAGDWLIYYSPREQREGGEPVQAFTAIGQLAGEEITEVAMTERFTAARRAVHWLPTHPAPIRPLLTSLTFIRTPERWGMTFRPGHLEIDKADFQRIAAAMGAEAGADAA